MQMKKKRVEKYVNYKNWWKIWNEEHAKNDKTMQRLKMQTLENWWNRWITTNRHMTIMQMMK